MHHPNMLEFLCRQGLPVLPLSSHTLSILSLAAIVNVQYLYCYIEVHTCTMKGPRDATVRTVTTAIGSQNTVTAQLHYLLCFC